MVYVVAHFMGNVIASSYVHIVLLGLSRFGDSMAMETIAMVCYPSCFSL